VDESIKALLIASFEVALAVSAAGLCLAAQDLQAVVLAAGGLCFAL